MATKSFDPTANPFELLASAESQDAAVARKKPARKQEAEAAQPVGATALTPAEKAKARAAKEAAKEKTKDSTPAQAQDKDAPKKKLTREQYLEEKRKGTLVEGSEASDSPATRPARARGDQSGHNSGNRGRGRGGNRGGRGLGRGRGGDGDKSGRALGDKEHHHQPPVHGREYDKKSGMKTGRHAVAKKGGVGSQNWGDDKDDLAGQTGVADAVDVPADDAEKNNQTEATEEQKEEVDNGLSYEEYLKTKAAQDAELAAKIAAKLGSAPAPRKVEAPADLDKYVDPHADQAKPAAEKKKEEPKKAGPKFVAVDEVFTVRTPPPLSTRGRGGRGRGRGGRGGGEGGRGGGEGNREHREGGNREHREGGNREHREGGNREHREGGNREHREGGDQQHRGDQQQRGGRGRGGRGQGRGQRRVQLDSNVHFPDLGSN